MKLIKYLLVLFAAFALAAAPQATSPARKAPKAAQKSEAKGAEKAAPKGALLDINTASEKELKELPGIGDAYSAKIIAGRPYRAKNQLVQKKIIPQATYDKIKDQIVATQPGTKK